MVDTIVPCITPIFYVFVCHKHKMWLVFVLNLLERSQNSFYDLWFLSQTVWPSTLTYTNGLACNFYAQTVWPPTKPMTQLGEVGCKQNRLREKKMKTTMVGSFARSIGMTIANTNKYSWEHHRKGLVEGAVNGLYGLENQLRKKLSITLIYFILFFTIFSTRSPRNRSDRTPLTSPSGRASFPTPLPSCTRFLSWLLCVSRRQSPLKTTTYCI